MQLLSVVIPAYNERDTVEAVVQAVLDAELPTGAREVILVDDGSTDGTTEIVQALAARHPNVTAVLHDTNRGKGAALRSGFRVSRGDVVLVQDADLEYDPRDYPRLLAPILEDLADVVYGSRFAGGESHRVLYYWHSLGNHILTTLSNMVTDLNLTDMETCYKVFRGDLIRGIQIEEDRFGFEPEITAKVARLGCRIYEVGIRYNGRTYEQGKKVTWRDGVHALWCILKYR